ncbi:hypothetical protein BOO92_15870 [Vibrio navarrensis]|uniref:hypothetical protein n=1 Tax=Vibrio navarrensis TaxID=29495 RepID=UPI00186733A1|nr:hypothetical protein [Vibrio navarrensis]HAS6102266.1 hypothetical protein [Vibrio vulnificus]EHA1127172.1 hypothetical protein [Vibrio navarrensis]MBE3658157.1 hypothetical protein [Vibrio navarrensis]MBH9739874.1 hypothetical protein [Vibrio navarrensis]HDY8122831.1 hypothetical protein [Vibrio vulnificus]
MVEVFQDPEVVAAFITGIFSILTTAASGLFAMWFFKEITTKRNADKHRLSMLKEISFFHELEKVALDSCGISQMKLRAMVRQKTGLSTSNLFSPSKIARMIEKEESKLDDPTFIE